MLQKDTMQSEGLIQRVRLALWFLLHGTPRPPEPPAISQEEVAEARHFFPRDKFFIFGHGRSGTTLLARLIRLHPAVHCNWQAHFFTRPPLLSALVADPTVREWLARRSNRWNRGSDLAPVVLRAAADFIMEREAEKEGAQIVGDKSPSSLLNGKAVENLHRIYPDARLVVIVRDPRDTLVSHRFQVFLDSPQALTGRDLRIREAFRQNPAPFLNGERSIFTEAGLRSEVAGWVVNIVETRQRAMELFPGRYCQVRFEDLLADTVAQVNAVWIFLGATEPNDELRHRIEQETKRNPDRDWQLQKDRTIARHLQKGEVGSWKALFTPGDRRIVREIAGDAMRALGYEL